MSGLELCQCLHLRRQHDLRDGCTGLIGGGRHCECKNFKSRPTAASSCADAQPSQYPDAAERRRYALGQMAAQLRSACASTGNSGFINASSLWSREAAVNEAMELLAIIERRQKEGK